MNISDLVLPPHHIEAEKWVLCCILLDESNLTILDSVWISGDMFYQKEHKIIMANMEALRLASRSIDVVTLSDCLGSDLDMIWWQEYLLELSVYLLTASVCREYCEILKDKRERRQVIDLTNKINASCYTDRDIKKIISRSILRLSEYWSDTHINDPDNNPRFYEKSDLLSWWNKCIDDKFWYMCNDLVIVYATAGTGKTERMCHIADHNGKEWKKVAYYALENSPRALKQRSSYWRLWLSKAQFQNKEYQDWQKEKIIDNYKSFDKRFELTTHDKDIFKMLVEIEKKAKEWYDLVIIDNLGKITRDWHSEHEVQDKFTGDCQAIKNKYKNITIVIVHHEAKRVIKHVAGNIRGNQKISDNATIVTQIWRSFDPDDGAEEKRLLNIEQTKDTEWWVTAKSWVYYNRSTYHDDYNPAWDIWN